MVTETKKLGKFEMLQFLPTGDEKKSSNRNTYPRRDLISLWRDFFSLPVVSLKQGVEENLPNRRQAAKNKLPGV